MKLKYEYGQAYYTDLHPGDIISIPGGNYKVLTEDDIDENGNLKQPLREISNSLLNSQSLTYLEPIVASNILPKTLIMNCDSIYLHQKSVNLEVQIPTEKVEQFDCIVINGIKFKKDKSE